MGSRFGSGPVGAGRAVPRAPEMRTARAIARARALMGLRRSRMLQGRGERRAQPPPGLKRQDVPCLPELREPSSLRVFVDGTPIPSIGSDHA
ncbi:hypothetical protein GCM10010431_67660 [Streptomyces kunmingensis]